VSEQHFLSASQLKIFLDCPRCFWLHKVKVEKPRGIFPSLPGAMDDQLKTWYDGHRAKGTIPPELQGQIDPSLILYKDQARMTKMRDWRTGMTMFRHGAKIVTALDDLLVTPDKKVAAVLDYKTKGSPPRKGDSERYYGHQLNIYALALREVAKVQPFPVAYLAYYSPVAVGGPDEGMIVATKFRCDVMAVEVAADLADELIEKAVAVIEGPMPEPDYSCETCAFVWKHAGRATEEIEAAKAGAAEAAPKA